MLHRNPSCSDSWNSPLLQGKGYKEIQWIDAVSTLRTQTPARRQKGQPGGHLAPRTQYQPDPQGRLASSGFLSQEDPKPTVTAPATSVRPTFKQCTRTKIFDSARSFLADQKQFAHTTERHLKKKNTGACPTTSCTAPGPYCPGVLEIASMDTQLFCISLMGILQPRCSTIGTEFRRWFIKENTNFGGEHFLIKTLKKTWF